ncbi:MAG: hypothetical protein ACOC1K_00590 [Nanoarchaeota archaeon]
MKIKSKEFIILLLGLIGSILSGLLLRIFGKENLHSFSVIDFVIILVLVIVFIMFVVYTRIREINNEINIIRSEQKRLIEKLKIYEQLIELKAEVKNLRYGNKK